MEGSNELGSTKAMLVSKKEDTTKNGKPYHTLKFENQNSEHPITVNSFKTELSEGMHVGKCYKIIYEIHGQFKNLTGAQETDGMYEVVEEETIKSDEINPAFYGMVFNKSVDVCIHKGFNFSSEDYTMLNDVFERLWDFATHKKKSKGVR